ncbi:basic amino acid ABC transporter substrate-binding protein [Pectinatus haikarae]|uniref:Polar amino acid transport system substrate-binding protein n=1 Tax=Pectinatus haikarae TaxID=349096 RepID=A0ABT9YBF7_9FIRM|nr:basic amino acid ABC transporter substrate-binding protein [Pectinatus haikarae]MDQ0204552.1 polar amino acid transport system substrate-binding protein [Pectinatus haikarae]
MKKILFLCMTALMSVAMLTAGCGDNAADRDSSSSSSTAKTLKIGSSADFAPFEFQGADSNEYQGFDMDLIRAIGKEMGTDVEINNIAFDGLIPALQSGNIDIAISGMSITDERKQQVGFSDPYYDSGLTIAVKADNNDINSFADLKGKKIAVQIGTTGAEEAKKIPDAQVKEMNSSADTFLELKAGNVDAVVNDKPVNDYYMVKNSDNTVKRVGEKLTSESYGIAVKKDNTKLVGELNAALKKLKENGEYNKIYKKWFGTEPTDNK